MVTPSLYVGLVVLNLLMLHCLVSVPFLKIPPRYTPEKSLGTFSTSAKAILGIWTYGCNAWIFGLILSFSIYTRTLNL